MAYYVLNLRGGTDEDDDEPHQWTSVRLVGPFASVEDQEAWIASEYDIDKSESWHSFELEASDPDAGHYLVPVVKPEKN